MFDFPLEMLDFVFNFECLFQLRGNVGSEIFIYFIYFLGQFRGLSCKGCEFLLDFVSSNKFQLVNFSDLQNVLCKEKWEL